MLLLLCISYCLTSEDLVHKIATKQPATLLVDFTYIDKCIKYDLDRKRQGTTEDKAKGRLIYKNGKYRLDVTTNRWVTTYTIIYNGVDTLVFHDNYPDANSAIFNQVNYYDAHHDGLIRDSRVLMLTLPALLFDSSVGFMSAKNTSCVNPEDAKALKKHVLRCKAQNSIETEAIMSQEGERLDSASIYNRNSFLMSFRFDYPVSRTLFPTSFAVRIVAVDNPNEIGRTIDGEYLKYEVNSVIDDNLFSYKFPKGTLIRDLRKRNVVIQGEDVTHVYIDESNKIPLPAGAGFVTDKINVILNASSNGKNIKTIIMASTTIIMLVALICLYYRFKRRVLV